MVMIGRAINGISLNGLEFVLTEKDGEEMKFATEEEAISFLKDHGVTEDDMECYILTDDDGQIL